MFARRANLGGGLPTLLQQSLIDCPGCLQFWSVWTLSEPLGISAFLSRNTILQHAFTLNVLWHGTTSQVITLQIAFLDIIHNSYISQRVHEGVVATKLHTWCQYIMLTYKFYRPGGTWAVSLRIPYVVHSVPLRSGHFAQALTRHS